MSIHDTYVTFPCVRALLFLFNIVFWFCGLAIVWAGIWLHTDLQNYLKISPEYSTAPPMVLVTIGTIIILVATLACTCIVKVQQTLLVIYGGFLIVILFTVITVSAYIYTYKDNVIGGLAEGIQFDIDYYGIPGANKTKLIDYIQKNLECCGRESYMDWEESKHITAPESCCRAPLSECNVVDPYYLYTIGCMPKLQTLINNNLSLIGASASAIAMFPLFGTMLTFCLAATTRKHGYEPIIQ
ncbi:tetraspanin-6-like [Eupeodes corollae]|uniref:tetraspanin-6-like n=1 Tax=Eupeodes corollae TaxID=290404 RepID=UPI002491E1F0|nr:tetraspanin-6-like [Eupeodes corollae]XP_055917333.1 tetraspanin-6-like [Eupeodes corollae]XP_055917334.1 tetraspanin-6-like [Eupeodes corollae]